MDTNTFKENGHSLSLNKVSLNKVSLNNLSRLKSNKIAPISRHKLQKAGLDKNTPVALIMVGEVVSLSKQLQWVNDNTSVFDEAKDSVVLSA